MESRVPTPGERGDDARQSAIQKLYRIEREAKENSITGEALVALRRRSMRAGALDDGASGPASLFTSVFRWPSVAEEP
jgi:hypothetical protein